MDDTIYRQAAIDTVMEFMPSLTTPDGCGQFDREIYEAQEMFVDIGQALNKLPSAHRALDEWCTDCKEYDTERHCCPRFNRVIRETLKDAQPDIAEDDTLTVTVPQGTEAGRVLVQEEGTTNGALFYRDVEPEQRWIPIKTRPMTEEERRYYAETLGWDLTDDEAVMFDCRMPEDGQEVWVCSRCGNVWQDACVVDEGIGLEGNGDWLDIAAWMPFEKPKPYERR